MKFEVLTFARTNFSCFRVKVTNIYFQMDLTSWIIWFNISFVCLAISSSDVNMFRWNNSLMTTVNMKKNTKCNVIPHSQSQRMLLDLNILIFDCCLIISSRFWLTKLKSNICYTNHLLAFFHSILWFEFTWWEIWCDWLVKRGFIFVCVNIYSFDQLVNKREWAIFRFG